MPTFEIEVRRISTVYVQVDARNEADAQATYKNGIELSTFIEDEAVANVIPYDDRFADDAAIDREFEAEEFEADDYADSSN